MSSYLLDTTLASATAPAAAAPASLGKLSGIWRGRAALEGRGICDLRFELREKEPSQFTGYSSFTCVNAGALMSAKDRGNARSAMLNHMNPDSAILTGKIENGAVQFHVDKSIGTDINGCAATSFTLTPFGTNQLAAEWQAGTCRGGHLVLQKVRS
jgi:hypothetical protein